MAPQGLRLVNALVIGVLGAALFVWAQLPLPWFLGAMTATMIAAIARVPLELPPRMGHVLRAVLGVTVGTAFPPELLARGAPILVSVAFVVPRAGPDHRQRRRGSHPSRAL